ncbi:SDR family NAD(P)-dependent oxidoreductase [Fretibacter rubidus]|uniref:SDR family NAD(P)-dependent oxidoreductase n=1 Tax=Fretibacter rubidus TaxID=570162 RepID=UPI00352A3FAF
MTLFKSFPDDLRVAIIGASGGIGAAMVDACVADPKVARVHALSRQGRSHPSPKVANLTFDFTDEASIEAAAVALKEVGPLDIVIVATGLLHGQGIAPEKNLRALSYDGFEVSYKTNVVGPAMTAKYFLPLMRRDEKAVFAALSARVGSISDNRLGGWYAYRASKAALNMVLKNLSIEHGRRFKEAVIIGLHPGTVDTALSEQFQGNVPEGKLFTPEFSAEHLLKVVDQVSPKDTGNLFAWDGEQIPF